MRVTKEWTCEDEGLGLAEVDEVLVGGEETHGHLLQLKDLVARRLLQAVCPSHSLIPLPQGSQGRALRGEWSWRGRWRKTGAGTVVWRMLLEMPPPRAPAMIS